MAHHHGQAQKSVRKFIPIIAAWLIVSQACLAADLAAATAPRPIGELRQSAVIHLGKTADWVTIVADGVWIGSTGPDAVHKIDSRTNTRVATVRLHGEPCAGLAVGFDSLWIPLCGRTPTLAKVDLQTSRLVKVFKIGAAAAEGGVTTSPQGVWLVVDKQGSLVCIDPETGAVRHTTHIPPGSYNPYYSAGQIWVTRAEGSEVTSVDAAAGTILATVPTGPGPRFLTAGAGAVWTLNQGDGSLTRIDARTRQATRTIALGLPGHGGDIGFGGGMIWTTMAKMPLSVVDAGKAMLRCQWAGPGGDSLAIGHGAIWLTDYHAGTIARIELDEASAHCNGPAPPAS